jgi:hypothetical protein
VFVKQFEVFPTTNTFQEVFPTTNTFQEVFPTTNSSENYGSNRLFKSKIKKKR